MGLLFGKYDRPVIAYIDYLEVYATENVSRFVRPYKPVLMFVISGPTGYDIVLVIKCSEFDPSFGHQC